jgi:acetyl esterase/lipase
MSDPLANIALSAIRVFEAAARLGSFTRAAQELGISQAAVSWQVKALERRLDLNLFRRLPREVVLTAPGERLARAATGAPVRIKVYPDAHHAFDSANPERYVANRMNPNAPGGRGATTEGNAPAWADSIREVGAFFAHTLGGR